MVWYVGGTEVELIDSKDIIWENRTLVKTFKLSFEIDVEILGRKDEGRTMPFQEERKIHTGYSFPETTWHG